MTKFIFLRRKKNDKSMIDEVKLHIRYIYCIKKMILRYATMMQYVLVYIGIIEKIL